MIDVSTMGKQKFNYLLVPIPRRNVERGKGVREALEERWLVEEEELHNI